MCAAMAVKYDILTLYVFVWMKKTVGTALAYMSVDSERYKSPEGSRKTICVTIKNRRLQLCQH